MHDDRPIGVFDSGLGGLSAVKELRTVFPSENIIYFGDTGRVPYGTRSNKTITKYALEDMAFLMTHDVKAVVVACGTASSIAMDAITQKYTDITIVGVVEAACEAALSHLKPERNNTVGVLGTAATIRAGAFEKHLRSFGVPMSIISRACPMLVPLVENGYTSPSDPVVRMLLTEYLEDISRQYADVIILGCTHYPMLTDAIKAIMPLSETIDTGAAAAHKLRTYFDEHGLYSSRETAGTLEIYVSDEVHSFDESASRFLGEDVKYTISKVDIDSIEIKT